MSLSKPLRLTAGYLRQLFEKTEQLDSDQPKTLAALIAGIDQGFGFIQICSAAHVDL